MKKKTTLFLSFLLSLSLGLIVVQGRFRTAQLPAEFDCVAVSEFKPNECVKERE